MDNKHTPAIKSSASSPDLDWSQVRETILMMGVAIGQIDAVMCDGDESVGVLANSFTSMSSAVTAIGEAAKNLPVIESTRALRETIEKNSEFVSMHMQSAIMAFQFYDRMAQRLDHVCHSIDALADLIADAQRVHNPAEWTAIQENIRSKYTIESERIMFDAILNGASVAEALELSQKAAAGDGGGDDIELF